MNYSTHIKIVFGAVLFSVVLTFMPGCSLNPETVKNEADADVYKIIDDKWDKNFGNKTNFKINDTSPSNGAIDVDESIIQDGILTLEQAVALATANNREYQTQKEKLYLKALDLRLARHRFGMNFYDHASISQSPVERLLATGAKLGTKVALGWANFFSESPSKGLVMIFDATITQPLLMGSKRAIVLEELTQSEQDTLYEIRQFNRFRKEFLVDVIRRYYRVLELYENTNNSLKNYRELTKIFGRIKTLTEAGKLPRHEFQQAHQNRLDALDRHVKAKRIYHEELDNFKVFLALSATKDVILDKNEFEALVDNGVKKIDFDESDAVETAIAARLDLANVADSVLDAERKVKVAEDGLQTKLNIGAKVDTARDVHDIYMLTAELDLPLDRMAEKNVYRKSLINLVQKKRDHEEASDKVVLGVREAFRNLTEARDRYLVQSTGLKLAQKRVDSNLLLLQYSSRGNRRANTRDVLDAQKDLLNAQDDTTDALIDFNIALLEFYRDTGALQVKPDGMWKKVAAK